MRELNLDQLRTLISISDLGSFSAAAQALHLAQPTVSLHVSELEQRLGTLLVVRGGRRMLPTSAGAMLIERGRRLLRDTDDTLAAVQSHAQGNVGRVRLGTTTGMLVSLLPQVLAAMARDNPGVDIEVRVIGSRDGLAGLNQGTLDVALLAAPTELQDLVATPWRRDPVLAYLPESWAAPKRIRPAWLADKPLIFTDASTFLYRQTMTWFAAAGMAPRARIELNYTEAIKSLVTAGYGAALLPHEYPAQAPVPGMQTRPLSPALTRLTSVVHRPLPALSGATRALLSTLTEFRQS